MIRVRKRCPQFVCTSFNFGYKTKFNRHNQFQKKYNSDNINGFDCCGGEKNNHPPLLNFDMHTKRKADDEGEDEVEKIHGGRGDAEHPEVGPSPRA